MTALTYLLKVSLLLAVLTLAYRWLIQYETFSKVNRVLLWLTVLAAWSLPLVPLAGWGPVEVQREFHQTLPDLARAVPVLAQSTLSVSPVSPATPLQTTLSHPVSDWLLLFYLAGAAVMAGRFLHQLLLLLAALRRRPAERLPDGTRLVRDETADSPYSFFRWVVCNPAAHAPVELRQIIAHETEHARQGHSFDLTLAEVQRVLLWFNPFAWVHLRMVQGNLEYLADRAVLANGFAKKPYQLCLLRSTLRTSEAPLTNSFAQSLLKKRIKMMNRTPSPRLTWGKYALLVALLYGSAAFVAPYKDALVDKAPAPLRPVVGTLLPEKVPSPKLPAEKSREPAAGQDLPEQPEPYVRETDQVPDQEPKSEWVQVEDGTLYWAIPPTASWEELNAIKADVQEFGGEMNFNEIKYDPTQQFITHVTVFMKRKGASGSGSRGEDTSAPMKGYSGYIGKEGLGMGQSPPEPLLTKLEKDYRKALAIENQNKATYAEAELTKKLRDEGLSFGTHGFSKESLKGEHADEFMERYGIGKSSGGTFRITDMHTDAIIYLNTARSSLAELNKLPFEKVEIVNLSEDKQGRKYVMVFTN